MFFDLYSQQIKVFLAAVTNDVENNRYSLRTVLEKAGMTVLESTNDDENEIFSLMKTADCSIHILGNVNIYDSDGGGYKSMSGIEYRLARKLRSKEYKMFIWNPCGRINNINSYINNIRRDIVENTIYSDKTSPIVFVEELRTIMNVKQSARHDLQEADIFFLYNELDADTAEDISNMLQDVQSVIKLGVSMSHNVDYNDFINQQLGNTKLGVVYYNYAADWVVSFARQIWKDTGGGSSQTPIIIAGNNAHAKKDDLKIFDGILECIVDDYTRIPLDIKIHFDKTQAKK